MGRSHAFSPESWVLSPECPPPTQDSGPRTQDCGEAMQTIQDISTRFQALREQLDRVILGQARVKMLAITTLVAGGHMLLEGVPGTGKTLLSLALSRLLGCRFRRIQFTPDPTPADLVGPNVFNQKAEEFTFRP